MKNIITILTILSLFTACDAQEPCEAAPGLAFVAPADAPPPADITFRAGEPKGIYMTAMAGKPIHRAGFIEFINACEKLLDDPPLTCSVSWYEPASGEPRMVLGLGCSMMATPQLWDCYRWFVHDNDGVKY